LDYFFNILTNVMLPIFLVILAGAVINLVIKMDVKTLSRLLFNLIIPVMLFLKIYESDLDGALLLQVGLITAGSMSILYILSLTIAKVFKFSRSETSVFVNTSTYFNSGNFSLPLMQILFNNPLVISIQAVIMIVQTTLFFTTGVYTAGAGKKGPKEAIKHILKMPLIYVIIVAVVFKRMEIPIFQPVKEALDLIGSGFSSLALLTLGAQLTQIKLSFSNYKIHMTNFIRLLIAPLIAFTLVTIFGIEGLTAQVLIIGMGAPSAVNVVLTAIELDNEPEFASQAVFSSTLLSSISLSLVIFLVFKYIPV